MRRWFQGCLWKLCRLLCSDSRWSPIFHKHKPTGGFITGSSPRPFKKHNLRQQIGIPKCSKMCEPFFQLQPPLLEHSSIWSLLRPEPLWLHNEHTPLAGPPGSHLVSVTADHTTTPPCQKSYISQLKLVAPCLSQEVLSQETEWNCTLSACGGSPQGVGGWSLVRSIQGYITKSLL